MCIPPEQWTCTPGKFMEAWENSEVRNWCLCYQCPGRLRAQHTSSSLTSSRLWKDRSRIRNCPQKNCRESRGMIAQHTCEDQEFKFVLSYRMGLGTSFSTGVPVTNQLTKTKVKICRGTECDIVYNPSPWKAETRELLTRSRIAWAIW